MSDQITLGPSSPKQAAFCQSVAGDDPADITLFGGAAGSGKSYLGILSFLKWVTDPAMSKFRGVVLRRTQVQVTGPGGPVDTAQELYQPFGPKFGIKDSKFIFPTGASIVFKGCEMEKDKFNFQGEIYRNVKAPSFSNL